MKVLLHGATDQNSSNFGDFIYGNEVYNICKSMKCNVAYYNPSDYFQKHTLNYSKTNFSVTDADLLVYFLGGYFGEVAHPGLKRCIKNFIRYMPFGISGIFYKKILLFWV